MTIHDFPISMSLMEIMNKQWCDKCKGNSLVKCNTCRENFIMVENKPLYFRKKKGDKNDKKRMS